MINRYYQQIIIVGVLLVLNACTIVPNKPYVDKDRLVIPPSSATVTSLLEKAYQYRLENRYQQTLSTLERAIRIEPADPVPWFRGAEVYYSSKDYNQSIDFAQRAASLSAAYPSLRRGCWRLIAKNHLALGQEEQARLAKKKANTI